FYLHYHIRRNVLGHLTMDWWTRMAPPVPQLAAPAVLFRSTEHRADAPEDLGWRALCPTFTTISVGGGHGSMLDAPELQTLCTRFTASVAQSGGDDSAEGGRVDAHSGRVAWPLV